MGSEFFNRLLLRLFLFFTCRAVNGGIFRLGVDSVNDGESGNKTTTTTRGDRFLWPW